MVRVNSRVRTVSGQQDSAATADAVSMGVGLVLFWPALFFLAATDDQKHELGRLKGEYEALQRASTRKKCVYEVNASDKSVKTEEAAKPTEEVPTPTKETPKAMVVGHETDNQEKEINKDFDYMETYGAIRPHDLSK
jgi:hypothetical protein